MGKEVMTGRITPDSSVVFTNKTMNDNENTILIYKPPIGIPYLWQASKPDWALDFGNGASTKYLWENYPNLNNTLFKSILTTHYNNGSCANWDAEGFYVPDLRGLVPIGYGTNAKRTGETTSGGNLGSYLESTNKSHYHNVNGSVAGTDLNHAHGISVNDQGRPDGGGDSPADKYYYWNSLFSNTGRRATNATGYWVHGHTLNIDTNSVGSSISKPPTFAIMWIVRYI